MAAVVEDRFWTVAVVDERLFTIPCETERFDIEEVVEERVSATRLEMEDVVETRLLSTALDAVIPETTSCPTEPRWTARSEILDVVEVMLEMTAVVEASADTVPVVANKLLMVAAFAVTFWTPSV